MERTAECGATGGTNRPVRATGVSWIQLTTPHAVYAAVRQVPLLTARVSGYEWDQIIPSTG